MSALLICDSKWEMSALICDSEWEMPTSASETVRREKSSQAVAPLRAQLSQKDKNQFCPRTTVIKIPRYPFPQLTHASKQHQNMYR